MQGAVQRDPRSGRARAAPLHQAYRPVQVDVGAQRDVGRVRDVVAGPQELVEPPATDMVDLDGAELLEAVPQPPDPPFTSGADTHVLTKRGARHHPSFE